MNALTYDECKSDMNVNTAFIVLTSRPFLRATTGHFYDAVI